MTVKKYPEMTLKAGKGDDAVFCKCHFRHAEDDERDEDEEDEDEEVEPQIEIEISGTFETTAFSASQLVNVIEALQEARTFLGN
jgi:hypothetical protein